MDKGTEFALEYGFVACLPIWRFAPSVGRTKGAALLHSVHKMHKGPSEAIRRKWLREGNLTNVYVVEQVLKKMMDGA